jgi:CheY-like chemotaxis protein
MTNSSLPGSAVLGPTEAAKRVTVLFVDDDPITTYAMCRVLASVGYNTLSAIRSDEAIAMAGKQAIDVLVTDVGLRTVDGFELAKRVLQHNPQAKVVYVSGHHYPECALLKPFTPKMLVETVDALVGADEGTNTVGC